MTATPRTRKPLGFVAFCDRVLRVRMEPGQRVFWTVAADGVDPCDLADDDRALARVMFGPLDRIPARARKVVAAVKGADIGWSYFLALRMVHRCVTADVSDAAPGETRWALVMAPDLELAAKVIGYARGAIESTPSLASLIESASGDQILLRRPDGRRVGIKTRAAAIGGRGGRGDRWIEAALDEAAFFRDRETGRVNDDDCYKAIAARVRTGQIWVGSTPWTESGLLWSFDQKNWGKPSTALAAHLPTLVMRADPEVRANAEREMERDPESAAREFGCEYLSGGTSQFFDPSAVDRAVDRSLTLPATIDTVAAAVGADLGFVQDASACVAVGWHEGRATVLDVVEELPAKGAPLKPSKVVARFAVTAKALGVWSLISDGHYRESVREHLEAHGMDLIAAPEGQPGKVAMYTRTRALLNEGNLRLPNHPRLIRQLADVVSKPTPGGGLAITSPRRKGAGHGDLVSALCAAVEYLARTEGTDGDYFSMPGGMSRWSATPDDDAPPASPFVWPK